MFESSCASAYMDQGRQQRLEKDSVFCDIIQRRVRGQKELTPQQKAHNRACAATRAAVKHPFTGLKNTGSFIRARYRGLARNAVDFALGAIAHLFKRSLTLMN
ncbi:MAG: hypothetical protein WD042_13490 [Phycisphaeraceae bacterium]